ncbi:hypothetical protein L3X38_025337 [Prunus dulcis]|uniref:Uncharacterized protein n=1 Tax=Prunus dulcis TaxID=3755 RepID=A0AAD4W1F5_PRUDU|nr:hypothetical protein L3X38_025337 [Prunus dulcis]
MRELPFSDEKGCHVQVLKVDVYNISTISYNCTLKKVCRKNQRPLKMIPAAPQHYKRQTCNGYFCTPFIILTLLMTNIHMQCKTLLLPSHLQWAGVLMDQNMAGLQSHPMHSSSSSSSKDQ